MPFTTSRRSTVRGCPLAESAGTIRATISDPTSTGLSPRVRGNRHPSGHTLQGRRSIPARAGGTFHSPALQNQSQGGMCIWAVSGIGPGGAQECFGPGLQDRPAAALHLVRPAGHSGEEIDDPLLNRRLASQAQVARRLLSRPAPDGLIGVEVWAVARQINQPQPQAGRPQILPYRLATPELAEGGPAHCPR